MMTARTMQAMQKRTNPYSNLRLCRSFSGKSIWRPSPKSPLSATSSSSFRRRHRCGRRWWRCRRAKLARSIHELAMLGPYPGDEGQDHDQHTEHGEHPNTGGCAVNRVAELVIALGEDAGRAPVGGPRAEREEPDALLERGHDLRRQGVTGRKAGLDAVGRGVPDPVAGCRHLRHLLLLRTRRAAGLEPAALVRPRDP